MVRGCLALLVDGGGAVIASKLAMIEVNFGWCGGGLELD